MEDPARALALPDSNWDALLARLHSRTKLPAEPRRMVQGVLAAPAAIACWISARAIELAQLATLRLLVIGAEKLDAVDAGRWYQLIPCMLDRPVTVQATLVGDRLDAAYCSPLAPHAPQIPAELFRGSLASFLAASAPRYDLAIMFHPGFQKHQGWLRDASLARLLAAGTRLVGVSYEHDESEIDRYVAECHGFCSTGEVLLNPYFLDFSAGASLIRWGRALWEFAARVPSAQTPIDSARLAQLDQLAAMVMHSIAQGAVQARSPGERTEFSATDGSKRMLYHIFDDYFLNPGDATVLAFRAGQFRKVGRATMDAVAAYPAADSTELMRALWAAEIKAKHLLELYSVPTNDTTRHNLARSMHANLESQVDELFRAS